MTAIVVSLYIFVLACFIGYQVIWGVSLEVDQGDFVAMAGPSGPSREKKNEAVYLLS